MRIKVLLAVLVMAISTSLSVYGAVRPSDKVLIDKAIELVRLSLKDPESARFKGVKVGKENYDHVRGEVNAKNGYGGYDGYDKFFVDLSIKVVLFQREAIKAYQDSIKVNTAALRWYAETTDKPITIDMIKKSEELKITYKERLKYMFP